MTTTLIFVRPEWFWLLVPYCLFLIIIFRHRQLKSQWQHFCDPALLPHILLQNDVKKHPFAFIMIAIAGLLTIIAISGPAWKKLPQPVFKNQSALVILLDLSESMNAEDIKPNRLERAKHKISDILAQRKEGQTALIAFSGHPFTVTPLTDDIDTIAALLPSLQTELMPVQGSQPAKAITEAHKILKQAAISQGHILLVTDDNQPHSVEQVKKVCVNNYPLLILALGSTEGAPIPNKNGGFIKNKQGDIVIDKANPTILSSMAQACSGKFIYFSHNDQDIQQISQMLDQKIDHQQLMTTSLKTDQWREEGPWLVLLLLPLAAFGFRKGILFTLLICLTPYPQPVIAMDWQSLWYNQNQRAQKAFQAKELEKAEQLFEQPEWKAASQYNAGKYTEMLKTMKEINTSDALYNKGNAMAKMKQFDPALKSYDEALKLDPDNKDAKFNRDLVKQLIEQNKQQQQQNQSNSDKDKDKQQKDQSQQKQSDQNQNDQNQKDDQNADQKKDQKQDNQQGQSADQNQDQDQKPQDKDNQAKSKQAQQKQDTKKEKKASKAAQDKQKKDDKDKQQAEQQAAKEQDQQPDEGELSKQQWLGRIKDDPGGLLRRKFLYQYKNYYGDQNNTTGQTR